MSTTTPHRRYNPLADRWVLVSPQRNQRPWQGQQESIAEEQPAYDPDCYLCPGNRRANGEFNPDYTGVFIFPNDFPALLDDEPTAEPESPEAQHADDDPLLRSAPVSGCCRVVCYSPAHNETLASLPRRQVIDVIDHWASQVAELRQRYEHVQVFENRGETMGCSNPHPHGQIWALDQQPTEILVEDRQQASFAEKHGKRLLMSYAETEAKAGERVVVSNKNWLIVVPWWASWPFETLVLPRQNVSHLPELSEEARESLADALSDLLKRYNRLFNVSFPYSMGWHGKPTSVEEDYWQLHAHFYPPLLRSATVRKHMVGFEMLGEAQRDLTPEDAAARLREV
ncbi:MAG: UDP-glucose--hexose-1-phosphate uridylyltransferase [Pseudomonadota bacterium]